MSAAPGERILLVGADGMLGRAWEQILTAEGVEHDAVSRSRAGSHHLDVLDEAAVERRLRLGYAWVINCTAYTAVDAAEADEEGANRVNSDAVRNLATWAERTGAATLHYSTDYVFSGTATVPYGEEHPVQPVNAYGRSKARGEVQLRAGNPRHLLIRTSWVYAPWGKNFVLTMRQLLTTQPRISVVDDQRGRPTSVFTLVDTCRKLMQARAYGTFHVADTASCSWFEFASEVGRLLGARCELVPCSTEQFPRPAPRPAFSVLDTTKVESIVGGLPTWQHRLRTSLDWPVLAEG